MPDKEVHITVKKFVILAIMLGAGCGENKRSAYLEENNSAQAKPAKENTQKGTQSKIANKNNISTKQVKELILEELIVGVYELNLNNKYLINSKYSNKSLFAKRPKNMCMNSLKFKRKFKVKIRNCYYELNLMIKDLTK